MRHLASLCLLVTFLLAGPLASRPAPADPITAPHAPGEVILKFKDNATQHDKDQILAELGGTRIKGLGRIKAELRRLEAGLTTEEAISRFKNHSKVEYIEPNYIVNAVEVPNDPLFPQLYGMQNTGQTGGTAGADIRATQAWDVFTGSAGVLVGVIDTGVDYTHPDLAPNIWTNPGEIAGNGVDDDANGYIDDVHGWDFINNDNNPMDDHGHGSHVSGTIGAAGDNGIGVAGVSWDVSIMALKFLSSGGSGSIADAIEAVNYATMMGVDLTSNSWGGGGFSQAMLDAINAANAAGILFVAAAGNSGVNTDTSPHYPSSYAAPNVVAVAATDHNDQLASFSNYGATTVDLAAPGVNILSTFPGNSYGSISGTSMATPHVSGALALIFGRLPGIGHLDAKSLLLNFADPKPNLAGKVLTGGRLNAFMPIADPDSIAPGPIADVSVVSFASNWLQLAWTASGDDGATGTASRFVVKVSTAPIDASNFDAATTVPGPPDPGPPGTQALLRVTGLAFSTTYYFAVKALDEFGNASDLSNVASGTTLGAPDIEASPLAFTQTLITGATASQTLTLSNVGQGTLDFQIPVPELITSAPVVAEYVEYGKDDPDPRPGILGTGGPDGFGYRWSDSDDPGGPGFVWTDISSTGTLAISTGDDVNVGPFPIGFTFSFYGVEYTQFRVCSNGWLSFTSSATSYSNQPLPNTGAPTALVAPFWDDLNPSTSGDVYYQSDGTRLVVQWNNIAHYGSGGPYTFQAILHADGTIVYQYLSLGSPTNSATVGIQNAARTDGLQVAYNAAYLHDNMAVRLAAIPQWVIASPASGTIYAPNSSGIDLAFNASGLLGGTYDANVRILSNDPDESPLVIPVQLTVIGAPDVDVAPSLIAFGDVFLGASPVQVLHVQNPGTDVLHVSSVTVDNPVYSLSPTLFDVPPRGSRDVEITFSPTAVGSYPATVTVASDDPDQPSVTMSLTGSGVVPPDFAVTPTALSSSLLTGETETQALTLSNSGGAALEWSIETQFLTPSQTYTLTAPEVPSGADEDGGVVSETPRTTPIQAELDDLTGVDIMFDRSHGQGTRTSWTTIIADLTARGATVTDNSLDLTPEILANYDIVWVTDLSQTWTAAELSALTNWMAGGGGLLLEGDNTATVPIYNSILTALGAGITFSLTDGANGISANIHPHPTTQNVAGVYLTAATASIEAGMTAPAGPLVDDINGRPNTAFSQIGAGRIIAAADELFQNARMSQANNQLFGNQVMDWLAGNNFLTLTPTAGTVPSGGTTNVNALFDATGLFGGAYQANVVIHTNDPGASEVTIPVSLQVTGAPDLTLDPTSLDFGQVFVGYPELQEFTVTNTGTDVLTITGISSNLPDFTPDLTGGTLPIQIDPLHASILRVRFAPSSAGPQTAVLTLASNDPDTPAATLPLAGAGLLPPVAGVTPQTLHHNLLTGETATDPVTISNTGNSDLNWSARLETVNLTATLTAPEAPVGPDEDGGEPGPDPRTTPIQAELADLTGVNILWDRSHGQSTTSSWTTIVADVTARGATVTQSTAAITPELLDGYDVLWSVDASNTWTQSQLAAVADWVNAGGAVLLEGDNDASVSSFNSVLNAVGAGITFSTTDGEDGTTTNIHPHATTENVTGIYLSANIASISSVASPAGRLVDDPNGVAVAAYSQVGAGRVIAASDELFQNTRMSQASNQLFGNQVIDWLSVPSFLAVDPDAGTVPAGGSAVVNVTFDASGLFGGDYAGRVRILSNDPANGVLDVTATMHVTGVPRIEASPGSVAFGDVFIGYSKTDSFTVKNVGTDHLSVTSMAPGLGDYTVSPATLELDPRQSAKVHVTFAPTTSGDRSTPLTIASNDPSSPHTVGLSGTGVVPPVIGTSPASLVGAALPGGSKTKTLTVCNTGGSDLVFQASTSEVGPTPTQVHEYLDLPKGTDAPGGDEPADPRPGILGSGGPDAFGYSWQDSDEPGGPAFNWVDIKAIGTPTDFPPYDLDGNFGPYPIGFNFPFYGNTFTEFHVSDNGWISFTNGTLETFTNQPLPNAASAVPENLLAVWWDDMVFDLADSTYVVYHNDGTRLIIEYFIRRIADFTPPHYNFQIILYPNGDIVYQYKTMDTNRTSATIGIQNAAKNDGLTVVHNASYVHDGLAIKFSSRPAWLSVSPESGVVPPGGCMDLAVTMNAAELEAGDYLGLVSLSSNDPARPTVNTDVVFHVGSVDATRTDAEPDVINLGAEGNLVKAQIELPAPYQLEDIVLETVRLNGTVPAVSVAIEDEDQNGVPDATFGFDRLLVHETLPEGDSVEVVVTGEIEDTIYFTGRDWVRVMHPRLNTPAGGETFAAGSSVGITWTNPEDWVVTHATLTFSPDGGQTWSLIADQVTGTSFQWQVPALATSSALVRVYAHDAVGVLGWDTSGEFTIETGPVAVGDARPTVHQLYQNTPNPFRSRTTIAFDLPEEGPVELEIFDLSGRAIQVLANGIRPAGRHTLAWDGRDAAGRDVAGGVYFYRLRAGAFSATKRMFLTR